MKIRVGDQLFARGKWVTLCQVMDETDLFEEDGDPDVTVLYVQEVHPEGMGSHLYLNLWEVEAVMEEVERRAA